MRKNCKKEGEKMGKGTQGAFIHLRGYEEETLGLMVSNLPEMCFHV